MGNSFTFIFYLFFFSWAALGENVESSNWLRNYVTRRKIAVSNGPNALNRAMAMGSTQPPTEINIVRAE
jgi:hypothetical protein